MKKRFLSLTLVFVLLLSACGQSGTKTANSLTSSTESTETTEQPASDTATEIPATDALEMVVDSSIATQKDEHADSLYAILASFPAEKPESSLKQADVECDTLQWLTSTYAIYCYHTSRDYHLIGGYDDETESGYDELKAGLEQSWGITDRTTAIESIAWLAVEGHSQQYNETAQMMEELNILQCDEITLRTFMAELAEAEGWSEEELIEVDYFYLKMKEIFDESGKNGIDAWDYSRIMQLSGQCYHLGYFTLEETLTLQLAVAQVIQEDYSSWEDWNQSYLNGYEYWTYGNSSAASRAWSYQKLGYEEDNPFAIIDFNMPLEKFW